MKIEEPTWQFLQALDQNNNKEWFHAHKKDYQKAKGNFEVFVDALISGISAFDDLGTVEAKQCTFRINRDMRFVKDGRPYNTHFSAIISPNGKNFDGAYYYLRIQPGNSELTGGTACQLGKAALSGLRNHIDQQGEDLDHIVQSASFSNQFGGVTGLQYKRMPSGFDDDHQHAEWLKMRQFLARTSLADDLVTSEGLYERVMDGFRSAFPLIRFINEGIQSQL